MVSMMPILLQALYFICNSSCPEFITVIVFYAGNPFFSVLFSSCRDSLLLEAGVLAVIAAPWLSRGGQQKSSTDVISLFLVRWLYFRLMFSSGIVKLTSGCPTWWGLSGMFLIQSDITHCQCSVYFYSEISNISFVFSTQCSF